MSGLRKFWSSFIPFWRTYILVLAPLLLLPLPLSGTSEGRCGYIVALMAIYWMTEAVPLAITALMPVFGFPLFGIMSTGEVCIQYLKETNMMFLGGLIVALAVEHCNLHKRIALNVMLLIGTSPRMLMAGFMFTTMFLSMWLSNTATTAMMVPIVEAVLIELYQPKEPASDLNEFQMTRRKSGYRSSPEPEMSVTESSIDVSVTESSVDLAESISERDLVKERKKEVERHESEDELFRVRRIGFMLSLAYAANCGGIGTLHGTNPNLVLKGLLNHRYGSKTGLNFATWMGFGVPTAVVTVFIAWLWLQFLYIGLPCRGTSSPNTKESQDASKEILRKEAATLGRMSFHESGVLALFILLVVLWFFRHPEFMGGWSDYFPEFWPHYYKEGEEIDVDAATPAMLVVFLLFVFPARLNFWCFHDKNDPSPPKSSPALMDWDVIQHKMPWGVVMLLGGGFAMAKATNASGLSAWLGETMTGLKDLNPVFLVFVACLLSAMVTEVASNTATSTILLPVLAEMAEGADINPLYLMLPATISCSFAFMLPVATPPNAIVFTAAKMNSLDMIKAGFWMNIFCVGVITLLINTLGMAVFNVNEYPAWANSTAVFEH